MAGRRADIQVVVTGLQELRSLNTSLNTYERHLRNIIGLQAQAAASGQQLLSVETGMSRAQAARLISIERTNRALLQQIAANTRLIASQRQVNSATDEGARVQGRFQTSLLKTAIEYRAISLVFHNVVKALTDAKDVFIDLDYQAARASRNFGGQRKGEMLANIREEMIRTGRTAKEMGEAFYQAGVFVKDAGDLRTFTRTAANLIVGAESDPRETIRVINQLYYQFGAQLDQTASKGENLRRITELLAVAFTKSQTEVDELTNTLKYVGPIAEAAKIPLDQLTATIMALDVVGQRGRMAGTSSGQFITQLLKNRVPGTNDVKAGKYVYKNLFAETPQGGMDLLKTLERIVALGKQMPGPEKAAFFKEIAGAQNAVRFVGALEEVIVNLKDALPETQKALRGLTSESEKLQKTMSDTWTVQFGRAWNTVTTLIAGKLTELDSKVLHIKGLLKDVADTFDTDWGAETMQRLGGTKSSGLTIGNRNARTALLSEVLEAIDSSGPYTGSQVPYWNDLRRAGGLSFSDEEIKVAQSILGDPQTGHGWTTRDAVQRALNSQRGQLQDAIRGQRALDDQKTRGVYFDPTTGKFQVVRQPGWSKPERPVGRTLSPEEIEKRQREDEARRNKLAQAAERQAREWRAKIGLIDDRVKRENRDYTAEELGSISQMEGWEQALKDKAMSYRSDPGLTVSERSREKADAGRGTWSRQKRESALRRIMEERKAMVPPYNTLFGTELARSAQRAEYAYWQFKAGSSDQEEAAEAVARLRAMNQGREGELNKYRRGTRGETLEIEKRHNESLQDLMQGGREFWRRLFGDIDPRQRMEEYGERVRRIKLRERLGELGPEQSIAAQVAETEQLKKQLEQMGLHSAPKVREAIRELSVALDDLAVQGKETARETGLGAQRRQYEMEERGAEEMLRQFDYSARPVPSFRAFGYAQMRNRQEFDLMGQLYEMSTDPYKRTDYMLRRERLDFEHRWNAEQRVMEERDDMRQVITESFRAFYHGEVGVGGFARNVGDRIVDKALENQLAKWTDPLVIGITNATATQEELIAATNALRDAYLGVDPVGGVAGGAAGASGRATSTRGRLQRLSPGKWNTSDFLGAGMAAYSMYQNGAQNGVTLGGILGGAASGYAMGGPVGAAIGAGLNLFGGLFGHRKRKEEPKDQTPAFFNTPSDFDYWAYRYRATGNMPTAGEMHAMQTAAPIVKVYINGSEVAATKVIEESTGLARVAQSSHYFDPHVPL